MRCKTTKTHQNAQEFSSSHHEESFKFSNDTV